MLRSQWLVGSSMAAMSKVLENNTRNLYHTIFGKE
jgi:hypothetical protein